jgi:hypothetical protein
MQSPGSGFSFAGHGDKNTGTETLAVGQREPARIPAGQAVGKPGFHEMRTTVEAASRAIAILPPLPESCQATVMLMHPDAES